MIQIFFFFLRQRNQVSPARTGSGAEALGPHEVVRVASFPTELTVQHRSVPVARPCVCDTNVVLSQRR